MTVEKIRSILEKEYGIRNDEEFNAAVEAFPGINIGIFTMPFERRKKDEPETVTIDDCLDMLKYKNQYTIIKDGAVIGFGYEHDNEKEKSRSFLMKGMRL